LGRAGRSWDEKGQRSFWANYEFALGEGGAWEHGMRCTLGAVLCDFRGVKPVVMPGTGCGWIVAQERGGRGWLFS